MENKLESKETKKLSYEELENVCRQLSTQSQQLQTYNPQLKNMLNDANLTNLYRRLDYLFKVIDEDNKYLSAEFKEQCGTEIEAIMTPPEQTEEENKEE